MNNLKLPSEK